MADFPAPLGTLPVLQYCPPAQLEVDPSYQRSVAAGPSRTLINRIAREWDWRLCQPLIVSRRDDGRLFVVDGQHRRDAAILRTDIHQLPCVIVNHEDAAAEARAFVALNSRRRPLTRYQLFIAALAGGDKEAVTVDRLVREAGLRLTGANNAEHWKPNWINCVASVQFAARRHGEVATRHALDALARGFEGQILRNAGTLFDAIAGVVGAELEAGRPTNGWLLIEVLRGADQDQWMKDFTMRAADQGKDRKSAAVEVLADAYREAWIEAEAA